MWREETRNMMHIAVYYVYCIYYVYYSEIGDLARLINW